MKTKLVSMICVALIQLGTTCYAAEKKVPASDLTPILGTTKSGGTGKYDFKRANHDLRLENVVMLANPNGEGSVITGSFTLTHLYKGPLGIHIRPADHVLVSFTAKDGKTDTKVTKANGKNPWNFIITAGATAAGAPPQASAGAAAATTGLSSRLSGDAAPFMAQTVVSLTDRLAVLSAKKY